MNDVDYANNMNNTDEVPNNECCVLPIGTVGTHESTQNDQNVSNLSE
jgi:hypothetical protein